MFTFGLCAFALVVTVREMVAPARERVARRGGSLWAAFVDSLPAQRRRFGGYIVHLAVIIIAAAVAASSTYKTASEASLTPGESFNVGPYTLTFERTGAREQPGRRFTIYAHLIVTKNGERLGVVAPALNYYENQREPIGTPDVFTIGQRDLYTSLLSLERDGSRVGVRAFTIPLVAWIWYALPLIAVGSLTALWPRRRAPAPTLPAEAVTQT
jgi:cytochrome c-type biogenesis protein CcmF